MSDHPEVEAAEEGGEDGGEGEERGEGEGFVALRWPQRQREKKAMMPLSIL
jgi:hypothetical protein